MADILEASDRAPRVLIADDDRGIVRFLAEQCASMGFEVQTATNGLQALIMASRIRPDVLITDVNMPEVDGLSVCLRLLGPDRKAIEVVVVTGGRSNPETVERCESFGAVHVRKGPELWESVRSALIGTFPALAHRRVARTPSWVETRERPRVLLVDDDPEVATFLASRLRKCGVDTLYAPDGVQGYRIACREEPSIIISDYAMPNGDAHYLLQKLRSTTATERMPIFVMTGRDLDETTKQNLMREVLGFPGVVRIFKKKPFDIQELFAALQKICAFEAGPIDDYSVDL